MTTVERPHAPPSVPSLPHHPETQQTKSRALMWVVIFVVLSAVGGGAYWANDHFQLIAFGAKGATKGKKRPPIPIVTATVRRGDLSLFLSSLGTVTARQTVTVRSRVDGELMKVLFTEGQIVKEGDLLAEIDERPYKVQLEQAEGQLARDKATLKQASLDLARDRKLIISPSGAAITQQALDAQVSTLGQYEGAVKTDQAMVDNARLQLVYCHITAPISGRIGLRLVDKGNLVQAATSTGLAVIAEIQPITIVFTVPQDEIFRVQQKYNTGEELVVEAWNRDLTTKLSTGRLLAIDNQVDTTTGTVRLKAIYSNDDHLLFPNEFVNTKLLIETRHNAVIVPSAAVQRGPNSTFAYVVKSDTMQAKKSDQSDKTGKDPGKESAKSSDKDNAKAAKKKKDNETTYLAKVEMRVLKLGPSQGDQTIVESGLSPGEFVVTEGTDKLQNDSQVELRGPKTEGSAKATVAEGSKKREAKAAR